MSDRSKALPLLAGAAIMFFAVLQTLPVAAAAPTEPPCPGFNKLLNGGYSGASLVEVWGDDGGHLVLHWSLAASTLNNGADGYALSFLATAEVDGPGFRRASGTMQDTFGCVGMGFMGEPEHTPTMTISVHAGAWGTARFQSDACEVSVWVEYTTSVEVTAGISTNPSAEASVTESATFGGSVTCGSEQGFDYDSELLLKGKFEVENPYVAPTHPSQPPPQSACSQWQDDRTHTGAGLDCIRSATSLPPACEDWLADPTDTKDLAACIPDEL